MASEEDYDALRLAVIKDEEMIPSLLCKISEESKKSLLQIALKKGHLPVLKILLDHGADIHEELESKTALEIAIENQYMDIIEYLIKHGVDVNEANSIYANESPGDKRIIKRTPINFAIEKGIPEIVEYLLKHGANVNQVHCTNCDDCPFENRSTKIARHLINLKDNANVNEVGACGCSKTSLEFAIEKGNPEIVEYLLNQDADMNIKTSISLELDHHDYQNECYTLLHRAVDVGNIEIVKLLLKKGADVNAKSQKTLPPDYTGYKHLQWYEYPCYQLFAAKGGGTCILGRTLTVLEVALFKENEEMIDLLLDHGAAIDIESDQVFSLHTAILRTVKLSIIEKLVQHGADVNSLSPAKKCTPLSDALSNSYDYLDVALYLLKKGANIIVNKIDTLLHEILLYNNEKHCEFVINYGANVNSRNEKGEPALHIAISARNRNYKKPRVLLDYGADINAQNKDGNTPLHLAIYKKSYNTILVLLQYEADVSIFNNDGDSPLSVANRCRAFSSIQSLMRNPNWNYSLYFKRNVPGDELCGFFIILMIILREASGQYVAERDLLFIRNEPMSFFYNQFKGELEATKLKKVTENVSYYDILTKSASFTETHVNKNDIENIKYSDMKHEFPFFSNILSLRVANIEDRKILIETSDECYKRLFRLEYKVPIVISVKISSYLRSADLISLWSALQSPEESIATILNRPTDQQELFCCRIKKRYVLSEKYA